MKIIQKFLKDSVDSLKFPWRFHKKSTDSQKTFKFLGSCNALRAMQKRGRQSTFSTGPGWIPLAKHVFPSSPIRWPWDGARGLLHCPGCSRKAWKFQYIFEGSQLAAFGHSDVTQLGLAPITKRNRVALCIDPNYRGKNTAE